MLAWWGLLFVRPETRAFFQMGSDDTVLMAFWLADIAFLAPASIVVGVLSARGHEYSGIGAWFVTGLVTYATAFVFAFALATDTRWLGVIFMAPAALWSGVFAIGVSRLRDNMFHASKKASTAWITFKTFAQIVVVWTLILVVIPYLLVWIENRSGINQLEFTGQTPVSTLLFVLLSIPGVWSAIVMSREGKGTPLPLDHATEFVVTGPYAYVRNPMAVSGIGQGLSVALFWGSPLVFVYAFMGSLIWQLVFRPLEERDLEQRFGDDFTRYRDEVRCWVPRVTPYRGLVEN